LSALFHFRVPGQKAELLGKNSREISETISVMEEEKDGAGKVVGDEDAC
jgi:hypothetical protein